MNAEAVSGPAGPDTEIPLARPVIGEREQQLVLDVLRSGRLSLGPMVPAFEQAVAALVGARCGSAVSSGTAGLHLALRAVGVSEGTEVITSPFSFVASANVAVYERARPVFVDIDPVTLNLDVEAVGAAVGPRTSALLPVHIFGYPADVAALEPLGLPIVEDACEALGARYLDGGPVGGRGHPAVFAFYANKQITTGEGGVVVCGDAEMKSGIDSERNQGRAPSLDWLDHDRLGFNYRLSDLACALGLAQLERFESLIAARSRVAELYHAALGDVDGLVLPCEDSGQARRSWFVYVVQLPVEADRDAVVTALGQRGIPTKPYFPAVHLMSYYQETFGYRAGQFPACEAASARALALPFFPDLTEGQIERVVHELLGALGRRGSRRGALASPR